MPSDPVRRIESAHLCLSCGAIFDHATECANDHDLTPTMDVIEVGLRLKAAWDNQSASSSSWWVLFADARKLYEAVEHYASEDAWLNDREYRGFPGFHARAVALNALDALKRKEPTGA